MRFGRRLSEVEEMLLGGFDCLIGLVRVTNVSKDLAVVRPVATLTRRPWVA